MSRARIAATLCLAVWGCGDPPPEAPAHAVVGGDDAGTEPSPPTGSSGPALAAWPTPTLTLGDPGTPPLEPIRVPVGATPSTVQVRWSHQFDTTATRGTTTSAPVSVRQSRTFGLTRPTPGTIAFEVVEAEDASEGGPPVDPAVALGLVGRQGAWKTDERCIVAGAGIDETDPGAAAPHLAGVLKAIVDLCPPLPEAPVGPGARWHTTEPGPAGATLTTEWRLVHRDARQVALTFETRSDAEAAPLLAEGRVALDRDHPVPLRVDARGRTTRVRPEAPGSTTPVTWTTTFELHAERFDQP